MSRPLCLVVLATVSALAAGCGMSHLVDGGVGAGDGGTGGLVDGGLGDGGTGGLVDAGPGNVGPQDAGPPEDSGWRPLDAGPPGDRGGDVWEGYIESYSFPSGSDRVRIVFDSASGDGPRTGVVVFGAGAAPPPATDPNVGYPPGAPSDPFGGGPPSVWEGFEYPIDSASVTGPRVQVTVQLGSLYKQWCELQMPVSQGGGRYGCLPNTGGGGGPDGCFYNDPATGEPVPVDCGRYALCRESYCDCTAAFCTAGSGGLIAFDFRATGNDGAGSVDLGAVHSVYLSR